VQQHLYNQRLNSFNKVQFSTEDSTKTERGGEERKYLFAKHINLTNRIIAVSLLDLCVKCPTTNVYKVESN